jgi:hypothetical protein
MIVGAAGVAGTGVGAAGVGAAGAGGAGAGGEWNDDLYPDDDCEDYREPALEGLFPGGLPACFPDANYDACGLDVTAMESVFPGMEGCMELGQPSGSDVGRCEGLAMITDLGDIPLPPCCRLDGRCGVLVSIEAFGESLGFPLSPGADFGCVDPLPFLAKVPVDRVPDFWAGTKEWPEEGVPFCAEQ